MNVNTISFLQNLYKKYYFRNVNRIEIPENIHQREFGFMDFFGTMARHLSFSTKNEFSAETIKRAPASIFCSNAVYESPSAPIEEKGWRGAELIFDVDSDKINTKCRINHDFWFCENCLNKGKVPVPPKCLQCGSPVIKVSGRCEECLRSSLGATLRLVSMMKEDFGVDEKDVKVYFSGNRGFHVHIYDKRFLLFKQDARNEIALYVSGTSLHPAKSIALNLRIKKEKELSEWERRIRFFLVSNDIKDLSVRNIKRAIRSEACVIDSQVTSDIHRIFRLAGTLHNITGMLKTRICDGEFNPDLSAVVLSTERVKLMVKYYPRFSIGGNTFGPYRNETVYLPSYAAVQILTVGLGEVIEF